MLACYSPQHAEIRADLQNLGRLQRSDTKRLEDPGGLDKAKAGTLLSASFASPGGSLANPHECHAIDCLVSSPLPVSCCRCLATACSVDMT